MVKTANRKPNRRVNPPDEAPLWTGSELPMKTPPKWPLRNCQAPLANFTNKTRKLKRIRAAASSCQQLDSGVLTTQMVAENIQKNQVNRWIVYAEMEAIIDQGERCLSWDLTDMDWSRSVWATSTRRSALNFEPRAAKRRQNGPTSDNHQPSGKR